jgi:penicillin-binding protein 1A
MAFATKKNAYNAQRFFRFVASTGPSLHLAPFFILCLDIQKP